MKQALGLDGRMGHVKLDGIGISFEMNADYLD